MSIADQLRKAVNQSGMSGNALAKAAGVSQPAISRFLQGSDIKFSAADKLAAYIGLELSPSPGKLAKPAVPGVVTAKTDSKSKAKIRAAAPPFSKGKSKNKGR